MAVAPAPGRITWVATRRTASVGIGGTFEDARSNTFHEPKDKRAKRQRRGSEGGRPTGFDNEIYRRRNEVERTINRLKNSRVVAIRYDKRAYVFHGTVATAAIRLWLRP